MRHDTFIEYWDDGNRRKHIRLNFPDIPVGGNNILQLEDEDVYGESMTLQESLFDGNGALNITGCIASKFSIDVRMSSVLPHNLKNQRIEVGIRTDQEYTWFHLFQGYVYSVNTTRTDNIIRLECYDALQYFADVNVYPVFAAIPQGPHYYGVSFFTLLRNVVEYVGLSLYVNSALDFPEMHEANVWFENNLEGTEIAFLDVIRAFAQFAGRFCLINRVGKVEFRDLTYWTDDAFYPSNDLFPNDELYPTDGNHRFIDAYQSVKYEDYRVQKIDKVTLRENDGDEYTVILGEGNNNYVVENVLVKCIAFYHDKQAVALSIYNHVKDITYMPFEATVQGRPYMEVGDAITLNVYDYTNGTPTTQLMLFTILNRTLKGIQWLEDTYSASGTELQPFVKVGGDRLVDVQKDISGIKSDISNIESAISDLQNNKQNFIDLDILDPTRQGDEGDLVFSGGLGSGIKKLWRYEDNQWVRVNVMNLTLSTLDIEPGVTDLEDGALYLVYE